MAKKIDSRTGFTVENLLDINKCRIANGLAPLKPTKRCCQKCRRPITNVRFQMFCEECNLLHKKMRIPMPAIFEVRGVAV